MKKAISFSLLVLSLNSFAQNPCTEQVALLLNEFHLSTSAQNMNPQADVKLSVNNYGGQEYLDYSRGSDLGSVSFHVGEIGDLESNQLTLSLSIKRQLSPLFTNIKAPASEKNENLSIVLDRSTCKIKSNNIQINEKNSGEDDAVVNSKIDQCKSLSAVLDSDTLNQSKNVLTSIKAYGKLICMMKAVEPKEVKQTNGSTSQDRKASQQ